MSIEENKVIVRRHVNEWTLRDPATIDNLIAADTKFFGWPSGIEGARQFYLREFDDWTDRQYTIENPETDLIAEGDQVAVKLLFHGTRITGEKEVKVGINIYRVKDGKIQTGWGVWQDKK
jgi:predicted ester cyclase